MNASPHPAPPFDPDRFLEDTRRGAEAIGAPYDATTTRRMLSLFEPESREGVIQYRVGSIPSSPVNYRIGCLPHVDWLARADEAGVIPKTEAGDRARKLMTQVRSRFPESFYLGADFDAARGFEKIYLLLTRPVPFADFVALDAVPDGLRKQRENLARHGLDEVVITAVDVRKASCNVYFVWREPTGAWLDAFAARWRHGTIPPAVKDEIVRSTPIHGSVATTWAYDRPEPLRWCVYAIALRYDRPQVYEPGGELAGYVLPPLHERFRRFDEGAGTQTDQVAYGIGWSFGDPSPYLKYERSYTRDLLRFYNAQTESIEESGK